MSDQPRYRVTEIGGYARPVTGGGGEQDKPGATFQVVDGANGCIVASFASKHVAIGLPQHVRINIARFRAELSARELEQAAAELLAS